MIYHCSGLDQAQTKAQGLKDLNTDLYLAGDFDGVIGLKPNQEKFLFEADRQGYADGTTRHWLNKYQIVIE